MHNPDEQFSDEEFRELLTSIDHPAPPIRANDIINRASGRSGWRSALLAAAAVLVVATAATATVRSSFIAQLIGRLRGERYAQTTQPSSNGATDAGLSRGISFVPGSRVDIEFRAQQRAGELRVRWTDVHSVLLTQTGAKGEAHYALTPTGVIVDNAQSGASYSLILPRTLGWARVRVAGREVLAKDADTISCSGTRDVSDACTITLSASEQR